ncbi:hypothetical protein [Alkalicoccus halolimnae]|uniref:Uncharacterized protein n=1 Tax=Alkalicoccus halolimnae TaxID=1667239 RepID=A0A5C7F315_9BACI|nr:hypothetical protein [Alkalicoccus halolimnae]TXF81574.1 hypothetical protein FTX54_15770 [Alkalicoccus halolimnae]
MTSLLNIAGFNPVCPTIKLTNDYSLHFSVFLYSYLENNVDKRLTDAFVSKGTLSGRAGLS